MISSGRRKHGRELARLRIVEKLPVIEALEGITEAWKKKSVKHASGAQEAVRKS